jgi:N-acetylneuraminate synthase/N,N'-diacetyllegionaminate synthase
MCRELGMKKVKIGKRWVGEEEPAYIVVEIGINHNGDVDLAKKMINEARKCGVDAVKFQAFKAKEFVSDPSSAYTYRYQGKLVTESMLKMFRRYEFDATEWKEVFGYCKKKNTDFFVTPQNPSDLDFILSIADVPAIKVGSDDLTNLELLEYYAKKNKPMIISAGMAYISEIEAAVNTVRSTGNNSLVVLHCVSSYPTDAEEVNLRKMLTIREAFDVVVGYSDHTLGSAAALGAVVLGARIIEKHFTLDKNLPGPDHWFSANPDEMRELIDGIRFVEKALGSAVVEPTPKELEMRKIARRSIVAAKDIDRGDVIDRKMVTFKRPGTGLAPKYVNIIIGRRAKADIRRNELITFDKIQ